MPRIAGVDVPDKKSIRIALTYIYGIGHTRAQKILDSLGMDKETKANKLTDEELSRIASYIADNYDTEGLLRRINAQAISRLREIKCYRGSRHIRGLPARGQRTKTNARTRKGKKKTVANKAVVKGH